MLNLALILLLNNSNSFFLKKYKSNKNVIILENKYANANPVIPKPKEINNITNNNLKNLSPKSLITTLYSIFLNDKKIFTNISV